MQIDCTLHDGKTLDSPFEIALHRLSCPVKSLAVSWSPWKCRWLYIWMLSLRRCDPEDNIVCLKNSNRSCFSSFCKTATWIPQHWWSCFPHSTNDGYYYHWGLRNCNCSHYKLNNCQCDYLSIYSVEVESSIINLLPVETAFFPQILVFLWFHLDECTHLPLPMHNCSQLLAIIIYLGPISGHYIKILCSW